MLSQGDKNFKIEVISFSIEIEYFITFLKQTFKFMTFLPLHCEIENIAKNLKNTTPWLLKRHNFILICSFLINNFAVKLIIMNNKRVS